MATRIQATPVQSASGGGSLTLTFGTLPVGGRLIVVPIIGYAQGSSPDVTVADNQGNTYRLVKAATANSARAIIAYAFNIGAPSGTFIITVTRTGGSNQQMRAVGIEIDLTGTVDPLVGSGTATGNNNTPTTSTAVTGVADVTLVACFASFRLNFNVTSITVQAVVPAWLQEYEKLTNSAFVLTGEADSRIVTGTGGAAQSVQWTEVTANDNWSAIILAFNSAPPSASTQLTQFSREVVEFESSTNINLTQFSREVVFPYTCGTVPPAGASFLLKADTDLDGLGGGGGGGGAFPYQGTGGDDDSEQYMAFVKTRTYSPGGDINRLGTAGQLQQPLLVAKRAQTALQLEIDRDRGAEFQTSFVDLTADGTETRCIRKFENAQLADAGTFQYKLGDVFNTLNRWSLDRFQVKQSADGDR